MSQMIDEAMGGGAPPATGMPDTGAAVTSSPSGDNSDNLRMAISAIQAYMEGEQDDEDLAAGAEILAKAQKLLAANQKLEDTATGAGPGARFLRKKTQQGGGGGGGEGY